MTEKQMHTLDKIKPSEIAMYLKDKYEIALVVLSNPSNKFAVDDVLATKGSARSLKAISVHLQRKIQEDIDIALEIARREKYENSVKHDAGYDLD